MAVYTVGQKILEERKRQKISGEMLCEGICSLSTLSRIENGSQKPSRKVEEALLQRLGCNVEIEERNIDQREMEISRLEHEMTGLMLHKQPLTESLEKYRQLTGQRGTSSNPEKQFLLMAEAIEAFYLNKWELPIVYNQLEEALQCSIPAYKERGLRKIPFFTQTEIVIINNLALVLMEQNKDIEAIDMLGYLIRYLEEQCEDTATVMRKYPMLLQNLAALFQRQKRHEELLATCEKGIHYNNQYSHLGGMAEFFFGKAVACRELGRRTEAEEYYDISAVLYKVTDKPECAQQIMDEREEFFKNHY